MADRTESDRVAECVHVLRGMGVSESTIASVHDVSDREDLAAALTETLADTDERALYDLLHETVARSELGLECPRDHDVGTATTALSDALERFDCTLSVTETDRELAVEATDAAGDTRETTVRRPRRLPDDDPLPVLAHAVEDLLVGTDLTVVLLTEREDVWRAALVPERRLTDLQERLGLRLTVFGRPLLCADQPGAFAAGVATAYATATDGGSAAVASPGGTEAETAPTAEAPGDGEATDAEASADGDAAAGEGPDADDAVAGAGDDGADAEDDDAPDYVDLRDLDPEAVEDLGGGPTRVVGETVEDIVREVTEPSDDADARTAERSSDDSIVVGGEAESGELVGSPDRTVADEGVEDVLEEVGVLEADDVDLDEALSSMAGDFDAAPPLPGPLAAATDGDA